jgi:hypothetical protein
VTESSSPRRLGWIALAVSVLFGLFYAYDLWEAVQNAIEVPRQYELFGLPASSVPWTFIWIGIAVPPLVYVAALLVGRRRSVASKALVLLVGLVLVAVVSLDVIALAAVS